MCASPKKSKLEQHDSVQDRFFKKQGLYSPTRAVIDSPDIPARGKLLLAVLPTSITGVVVLGIRNSPWQAYAALLICTLALALLLNQIKEPQRRRRRRRSRLSLDLDAQTKANFESLRKRTGTASLTDLIRKSVALYDLVTEHAAEGGKVVFRHKSGEEEQLRFL